MCIMTLRHRFRLHDTAHALELGVGDIRLRNTAHPRQHVAGAARLVCQTSNSLLYHAKGLSRCGNVLSSFAAARPSTPANDSREFERGVF